ncbi:MAG: glucose-1-phosphate cytidylyltransferase [Chloroflexi bacterium]|nr:glucose-1-phosphate cytidylyltransferase [Chloroflexota bacterium]MBV9599094.1 glucose-1-phosphate cytidylyltransferase [Chloroflexota bacterium]
MKVVLFCGGMGFRIRDNVQDTPKPMIVVGDRPILFHIMKYYASYGHTEFILCLGYKGHLIKEYFLGYKDALHDDFVLSDGGRTIEVLHNDIADWRITFVETGLHANIGERLKRVQPYIGDDEHFLANYADVLTDAPLPDMIERLTTRRKVASFLCVRPRYTFHVVTVDSEQQVSSIDHVSEASIWINGGYFVFSRDIFDYLRLGEDLVAQPFNRLVCDRQLLAYQHEGFWAPMDTFKDHQVIQSMYESGLRPWAVWENGQSVAAGAGTAVVASAAGA